MDLISLGHRILTSIPSTTNGTNATVDFTDLPIKILESVIPGYSLFNNVSQQYLGFDLSLFMTIFAFCYIVKSAFSYIYDRAYYFLIRHFTSSVRIDGTDDLYLIVVQWISATRPDLSKRSLTARTSFNSSNMNDDDATKQEDEEDLALLASVTKDSENGFLNFSKWSARLPPYYEPDFGSFWFMSSRGVFEYSKIENRMRASDYEERVELQITLRCIGLTSTPIKNLLTEIKNWAVARQSTKTMIRVPDPYHHTSWYRASARPSRPMNTVILDSEQKSKILWDMNEYLHPMSAKWYAARGIPYRRGYLFHGPPGTGKTSLSFALAGIFGLDIHIVNLMDPELDENMLSNLFNSLPKKCIVLFEDIDAAGMEKRDRDGDYGDEDVGDEDNEKEVDERPTVKAMQRVDSIDDQLQTNGIHKSDIDLSTFDQNTKNTNDVQEDQGICLTQVNGHGTKTTSTTENSDGLLTTPYSTTASSTADPDIPASIHQLARAILSRTRKHGKRHHKSRPDHESDSKSDSDSESESDYDYDSESDSPSPPPPPPPSSRHRHRRNRPKCNISLSGLLNVIDGIATHEGRVLIMTTNYPSKLDSALTRPGRIDLQISFTAATKLQAQELFLRMFTSDEISASAEKTTEQDEVEDLAVQFADQIPEKKFSPADIQGYLLVWRKKPREAVEGLKEWRDEKLRIMAAKQKKNKKR